MFYQHTEQWSKIKTRLTCNMFVVCAAMHVESQNIS